MNLIRASVLSLKSDQIIQQEIKIFVRTKILVRTKRYIVNEGQTNDHRVNQKLL
jgi:hypothetical protein